MTLGIVDAAPLIVTFTNSLGAIAGRADSTQAERSRAKADQAADRAELARIMRERNALSFAPTIDEAVKANPLGLPARPQQTSVSGQQAQSESAGQISPEIFPNISHSFSIQSIVFSRDGLRFLTGSADNTIKIWDITTGHLLRTFEGHHSWVNAVAFSPDG